MKDITLIPLQKEHLEIVRKWRNSEEVSRYMFTSDHINSEQQEKWFEKVSVDKNCRYWIIQFDNKLVGLVSITGLDENLNSCYWAFYIGDTSVRGAGIGSKVEFHILEFVFEQLKLNKLRSEVFTFNDRGIKMHEKFGFRREAYYREHCFKDGKFEDVVGLAMLRSEWLLLKTVLKENVYGE